MTALMKKKSYIPKDKIEKQVNSLFSSENKQYISSYILQEISQKYHWEFWGQKAIFKEKKSDH